MSSSDSGQSDEYLLRDAPEGTSRLELISARIVSDGSINWRRLFSLLFSGFVLWAAGLLSALISGIYRLATHGVTWAIESLFSVWELIPLSQTWIVSRSFEIAGSSLDSEFGVLAFVMGVGLLIVWFVAVESIFAFFRGWWG